MFRYLSFNKPLLALLPQYALFFGFILGLILLFLCYSHAGMNPDTTITAVHNDSSLATWSTFIVFTPVFLISCFMMLTKAPHSTNFPRAKNPIHAAEISRAIALPIFIGVLMFIHLLIIVYKDGSHFSAIGFVFMMIVATLGITALFISSHIAAVQRMNKIPSIADSMTHN